MTTPQHETLTDRSFIKSAVIFHLWHLSNFPIIPSSQTWPLEPGWRSSSLFQLCLIVYFWQGLCDVTHLSKCQRAGRSRTCSGNYCTTLTSTNSLPWQQIIFLLLSFCFLQPLSALLHCLVSRFFYHFFPSLSSHSCAVWLWFRWNIEVPVILFSFNVIRIWSDVANLLLTPKGKEWCFCFSS